MPDSPLFIMFNILVFKRLQQDEVVLLRM